METSQADTFLDELEFQPDAAGGFVRVRQRKGELPEFTATDLRNAKAEAYAQGQAAKAAEIAAQEAERLPALVSMLAQALLDLRRASEPHQQLMVEIVHLVLAKLLPRWMKREGFKEVQSFTQKLLDRLGEDVRVRIVTQAALSESLQSALGEYLTQNNLEDRLVWDTSNAMGPYDIEVKWDRGGIERSVSRFLSEYLTQLKNHHPNFPEIPQEAAEDLEPTSAQAPTPEGKPGADKTDSNEAQQGEPS